MSVPSAVEAFAAGMIAGAAALREQLERDAQRHGMSDELRTTTRVLDAFLSAASAAQKPSA